MKHALKLLASLLATGGLAAAVAAGWPRPAAATATAVEVHPEHAFGMQYVPKFDEAAGRGAWSGTRTRGLAFHRDLGVQVSREGFLWRHYEPEPGKHDAQRDFDDAVFGLGRAHIALQAMVTETPLWASTAPRPNPKDPTSYKSAPPKGLHQPIFADGTDRPGPGKQINPANTWAAALDHMVSRYRGQVRYWQVWNEPDYPNGDQGANYADARRSWFGSVGDYVRLLEVGHTVVKWRDPQAQVVTGGIGYAPYLQAMLDRGAGRYFDQIDFHAYGWPGSDKALAEFVRVHDQLKAVLVRNGLGDKGLLCSETGYTALAPALQADYIAKLYPTAIATRVESTMYYANVNPSWKTMGLIDWRTMSQKTLGYWAYKHAAAALRDVRTAEPLMLAGARGYRFTRRDGSRVVVAWAPEREARRPLKATLPLTGGPYQVSDAVGRPLGRQAGGAAAVTLTASPLYFDSDLNRNYTAPAPNPPLAHPGLAMEKAVADSTNEHHGGAGAAIDLDPDTNWVSGGDRAPEAWLEVALRREALVGRLRLKTGPTPAGTWFDVETSSDGKTFVPAATQQVLRSWGMEEIRLTSPRLARHVRLHWHNPQSRGANFVVFELEVHPEAR